MNMIKNLKSKMEAQINRIEAWSKKIQEMFNKDLEETEKSQSIIKEVTSSRITEAENRISEMDDRMVEINEAERKKEKIIKRN